MADDIARPLADHASSASIPKAVIGGGIAALIGAAVWAMVAIGINTEIGWIAIGVGFICGFGVRLMGKGADNSFRAVGAGCAVVGILLGKWFTASHFKIEFGEMFGGLDLLFFGIAIWEGWKFSVDADG
jgi:hypothetical protein